METLPKALSDEIESLEELDARALKKKYPTLLSDAAEFSASGILRYIVAYRLQPTPRRGREVVAGGGRRRPPFEGLRVRLWHKGATGAVVERRKT